MPSYLIILLSIVAAYLLGSVPFAIISSKLFGLADPRSYGSKNPGATNVLRSGNKKAATSTPASWRRCCGFVWKTPGRPARATRR